MLRGLAEAPAALLTRPTATGVRDLPGPPPAVYNAPVFVAGERRVAIAHDWLNQAGGAEVVLGVLHDMFPTAPIFTTLWDPDRVADAAGWDVRVSWIDRLPGIHTKHQPYLPLYPVAWGTRRISGYELVISNKSGFCHGVRAPGAVHVCYCLTPTRYVWQLDDYLAFEAVPAAARLAMRSLLPLFKRWDLAAADRVDHFVAISTTVRDRIRSYYGRESTVIHPPAAVHEYRVADRPGDHYLVLSRLVPYKRIDLAVRAFTELGSPLVVVGDGRDRARLEAMAGPSVSFAGRLPATEVAELLAGCKALVWTGVEDFGLAPVEAMASGRPVIARRAGGVLDTVVEGVTGVFFDAPDPRALARAVQVADAIDWDSHAIRRHAQCFDRQVFEHRMMAFIEAALSTGPRAQATVRPGSDGASSPPRAQEEGGRERPGRRSESERMAAPRGVGVRAHHSATQRRRPPEGSPPTRACPASGCRQEPGGN